jgi:hypothetical protein
LGFTIITMATFTHVSWNQFSVNLKWIVIFMLQVASAAYSYFSFMSSFVDWISVILFVKLLFLSSVKQMMF